MDLRAAAAALQTIGKSVRQLSRVPSQAARGAAPKIERLLKDQFVEGRDPYGEAWEPLAESTIARGRNAPPLTDTEALSDVSVMPAHGAGIQVKLGAPYGAFHQVGTRAMPARTILPSHGLPASWRDAIAREVKAAVRRVG
jgi:hypothetical protein